MQHNIAIFRSTFYAELISSLRNTSYFRPSNMIAQSQSGTGKTAAFVLTMLSRVNTTLNHPQVSVLDIVNA